MASLLALQARNKFCGKVMKKNAIELNLLLVSSYTHLDFFPPEHLSSDQHIQLLKERF